jgi:hypothetical protein
MMDHRVRMLLALLEVAWFTWIFMVLTNVSIVAREPRTEELPDWGHLALDFMNMDAVRKIAHAMAMLMGAAGGLLHCWRAFWHEKYARSVFVDLGRMTSFIMLLRVACYGLTQYPTCEPGCVISYPPPESGRIVWAMTSPNFVLNCYDMMFSGHMSFSALWGLSAARNSRQEIAVWCSLGVLGVTLVGGRMHYSSDVIVGAMIGWGAARRMGVQDHAGYTSALGDVIDF